MSPKRRVKESNPARQTLEIRPYPVPATKMSYLDSNQGFGLCPAFRPPRAAPNTIAPGSACLRCLRDSSSACWRGYQESNPGLRCWRPPCYRNTLPTFPNDLHGCREAPGLTRTPPRMVYTNCVYPPEGAPLRTNTCGSSSL